jgi:hypothetical protein
MTLPTQEPTRICIKQVFSDGFNEVDRLFSDENEYTLFDLDALEENIQRIFNIKIVKSLIVKYRNDPFNATSLHSVYGFIDFNWLTTEQDENIMSDNDFEFNRLRLQNYHQLDIPIYQFETWKITTFHDKSINLLNQSMSSIVRHHLVPRLRPRPRVNIISDEDTDTDTDNDEPENMASRHIIPTEFPFSGQDNVDNVPRIYRNQYMEFTYA